MAKIGSLEGVFAPAPSQINFHIHIGFQPVERGKVLLPSHHSRGCHRGKCRMPHSKPLRLPRRLKLAAGIRQAVDTSASPAGIAAINCGSGLCRWNFPTAPAPQAFRIPVRCRALDGDMDDLFWRLPRPDQHI